MTTSIYNAAAAQPVRVEPQPVESAKETATAPAKRRHTIASRLVFLMLCVGIVLTTLAYGTVHYWALASFSLSAAAIVCLWTLDGLVLRSASLSLTPLQWPLLAPIVLLLLHLLPSRPPQHCVLPT